MPTIEQLEHVTPLGALVLLMVIVLVIVVKGANIYEHKIKTTIEKKKVNGEMGQVIRALEETSRSIGGLITSLQTYVSEDRQAHGEILKSIGSLDKTATRTLDGVRDIQSTVQRK